VRARAVDQMVADNRVELALMSGRHLAAKPMQGTAGAHTRIEAITFDFFQTLARHPLGFAGRGRALMSYLESLGVRTVPWEHKVLYDVFEVHGREYSPDDSVARKHAYFVRLAERVFARLGVPDDVHEPAKHATRIWQLIGPTSLEVYPETIDTLMRLRTAGYRLAIISNWQCGLGHFCTELGLSQFLEHVIVSAEVGHEKPSRAIFDEAANRLGVAHSRILHVGDSVVDDWDGARAAGLHALLVDRDRITSNPELTSVQSLAAVVDLVAIM
jgi:HAD superfamily hydrolase (TIGR01549 family)